MTLRSGRFSFLSVLLLGLLGPAFGLTAYQIAFTYEDGRARARFDEHLSRQVFLLEKEILTTSETLFALKSFYENSDEVARGEFQRFTAPALARHPGIQAFEWIPRVRNEARREHELGARLEGLDNYQITDRVDDGTLVRAAEKEEYYPVYFVEPYKGNELALGFDVASDTVRQEALDRAADSGRMAMTDPVKLVQDPVTSSGFLLFLPVDSGESSSFETHHQTLRGFVLLVFRIDGILSKSLLLGENEEMLKMHFKLVDKETVGKFTIIYSCAEFDQAIANEIGVSEELITVGGQNWTLLAYPTEAFLNTYRSYQPLFAGAGVFLTWELFGGLLVLLGKRSRQQALSEQAKLIHSVLMSLSEGVVVSDHSGKILMTNTAAERITGTSPEDVAPEKWSEVYCCFKVNTDEPYPSEQLPLARALRGEGTTDEEILIRNPQLSRDAIISVTGNPLKKSDGKLWGGVITIRDVTLRKKSEEELERLSNVVKQTADTVFITDQKGVIEYVNPAFEATTGYLQKEVLGQKPRILKSGLHESEHYQKLWESITRGDVYHGITVNRKKNRELYYSEQTITPMKNQAGRITHFVSVAKDITELRKVQEQEFEMNLAAKVQQKLYPTSQPRCAGFDIAGAVFSASATCGDYLDFIQASNQHLAVAIGDVSGHGFGAALVMAETRAFLRSFLQTNLDLGSILSNVNSALFEDLETNRFVTMLLAQLDVDNGRLTYASAGHNPGYILDKNGDLKAELSSTGFPLGMFSTSEFTSGAETLFDPGDLAVLLTDGFSETEGPSKEYLEDGGVLEILRSCRHKSARQMVDLAYERARDFARGVPQQDDMTIVVIKKV